MNLAESTLQSNKENEGQFKSQLNEINKRLELSEEKFISDEINRELYEKFSAKYKAEKNQILEQIEASALNLSNLEKTINKYCNLLMNVPSLWASGGYDAKRELQNFLFTDGI